MLKNRRLATVLIAIALGLVCSCAGPREPVVESVDSGQPLAVRLESLTGARDGGTLRAHARLAGEAGRLDLTMSFQLGVPTTMTSGSYQGEISGVPVEGGVRARSVTFLGGQSDRPSLGGSFSLLDADGVERYRLKLPTLPVQRER